MSEKEINKSFIEPTHIKLVQELFFKFLNIKSNDYHQELEKALNQMGTYFGLDRIYIYYFCEDPTFMKIEAQWNETGVKPKREQVEEEITYTLPWLMRSIKNNKFIAVNTKEDLPDEALFEAEMLAKEGIESLLMIPLKDKERLIGFIGYESLLKKMIWEEEQIEILSQIASIFSFKRTNLTKEKTQQSVINGQAILLNNAQSQIWALSNITSYETVNESHAEFFGKSRNELERQDLYDVFDKDTANQLSKINWELFEKQGPAKKEVQIKNAKGEERLLQIKSKPQRDSKGNIKFLICTAEDITEQRKAETDLYKAKEEAEAANIVKGQFLANMSHEIRTPLNGILGFLELLQTTSLAAEQKEFVREAKSASQILLHLINDILDFSKMEAKKLVLESIPFDLIEAIEDTVSLSAPKAAEKGLEIYTIIKQGVPQQVMGDPSRLKQVLNNLLSNAVKFTKEGEICITIECLEQKEDEAQIHFEVKDNGIGIKQQDIESIFQSFNQADASTTREYGGTGLGLAICHQLVNLMGGSISVESIYGQGASFKFDSRLQVIQKELQDRNNLEKLKGVNVLIIDEHSDYIKSMGIHLQQVGMHVFEAQSGAKAIGKIFSNSNTPQKIQVVIVKDALIDMESLEFIKILKTMACAKEIKVVLLTSVIQKEQAKRTKEYGVESHLIKPVRRKDLLMCMAKVMGLMEEGIEEAQQELKKDEEKPYKLEGVKILLVEDNPMNQKIMLSMLKRYDITCDTAANGLEALQALAQKEYDLVLMDCQMPIMDGYQCTSKIRLLEGDKKHTPIIALTANAMAGDAKKCLDAGMDDYITKPVHFGKLLERIIFYTEKGRPIKEAERPIKQTQPIAQTKPLPNKQLLEESVQALMKDTNLDEEDAKEIIEDYMKCLPELFLGIEQGLENKNFKTLSEFSHELKGSSGNLRINTLYELAIELDKAVKKQELSESTRLFQEIKVLFN
jgi:PAS domain S-box-containing protein